MAEEVFKEHVKMLERKFLLSNLAILKAWEEKPTKIEIELKASRCKLDRLPVLWIEVL